MAHKTGAAFADYGAHIIHGAANAMYLPKVIAFNAKDETAKKRYGEIADFMGLGGGTLDEKVALLITYLRGMNDDLRFRTVSRITARTVIRLSEVCAGSILRETAGDCKMQFWDACTGSNPRQPSQEDGKLLKCCYCRYRGRFLGEL